MNEELLMNALQTKQEEMKKCPDCGTSYVWFEQSLFNGTKHLKIQVPNCTCMEEKEKAAELAKIEAAKAERLAKLFDNSLMTPLFQEKTFDRLNDCLEVKRSRIYAEKFNPKTSSGIQMIGNIGTGKTTCLAAICNELLKKGNKCLFTTLSDLLDKFSNYSYENAGNVTPLLNWLTEFDFVVLDDIGRETYTDKRKEISFRIIDTLLNHKKIVAFTANPEMLEKLKRIPEWNATLDRLKDMCKEKFEFKGQSMRGQNA